MGTNALPSSSPKNQPRSYDTGFPKTFCGTGNTTKRHPDAIVSPNASISAEDIDIKKSRSRLGRYRHTARYGKITPGLENVSSYSDITTAQLPTQTELSSPGSFGTEYRPSRDGGDNIARMSNSSIHRQSLTSAVPVAPSSQPNNVPATTHHSRGRFLRKLRFRY